MRPPARLRPPAGRTPRAPPDQGSPGWVPRTVPSRLDRAPDPPDQALVGELTHPVRRPAVHTGADSAAEQRDATGDRERHLLAADPGDQLGDDLVRDVPVQLRVE